MVHEIHALKVSSLRNLSSRLTCRSYLCEFRSVQGKIFTEEPPSREEKGLFLAGCRLRRQNNFPRIRRSEPVRRLGRYLILSLYATYKPETATPSMINARFPPFLRHQSDFVEYQRVRSGINMGSTKKVPWGSKTLVLCLGKDRGTQREHSSKPLKHIIFKRIFLNARNRHIFYPLKIFHLFAFPS